jgi:hypothetical protein
MSTNSFSLRSRQRGVVILTLILVVLSTSSFVVLKALNASAARQAKRDNGTKQSLMEAKRALIGYAVAYQDDNNPDKGPGHLPCPDRDGGSPQGIAEANCQQVNDNETGRLPFRTLGLSEIKDGTGSPLWYAISDVYRSAAGPPLNSATTGTLQVDGANDVVAVIIAPGTAFHWQARTSSNDYDAGAFLEDDNASIGDGSFVTAPGDEFNDVVVQITRGELMTAVERTVLNEVAAALGNYFDDPDADDDANGNDPDCGADPDCDDGYPWLADFTNPEASNFVGAVDDFGGGDLAFGHLPLVRWDQPVVNNADFTADWSVATGGIAEAGADPPDEDCVRDISCTETFPVPFFFGVGFADHTFPADVTGALGGDWSQGTCRLSKETIVQDQGETVFQVVNCVATYDFRVTFMWEPFGLSIPISRDLRRVYELRLLNNQRNLAAPSGTSRRTFGMQESDGWSGAESTITVTDYDISDPENPIGSAVLTFDSMNTGDDIGLAGVPFDLEVSDDAIVNHDVSPGELPNWFAANLWHQQVLVQYAQAESPGDTDLTCVNDGSCLTLNLTRPGSTPIPDTSVRGVVLTVGPDLSGNRPTAALADYLEGNNATIDVVFDKQQVSAAFNDQLITLPLQRP